MMLIETNHYIPLYLKEEMNKEEFYAFCIANKHLRIERDENNQIYIMPPVFGDTGNKHSEILAEIVIWNRKGKLGRTFDSSTGFELPDGSMRCPDAAWITNEKWNSLLEEEREQFFPFAPDFVVEVLSPTDKLTPARE